MGACERILVIADPRGQATAAVRRGAQLARKTGARLSVCLFVRDPIVERAARRAGAGPDPIRAWVAERQARFAEALMPWIDPAVRPGFETVWAPLVHEAILAAVLQQRPDLVIKDAGAQHRLWATAGLDWKLQHLLPAPLMLVHPATTQLPRCILAAVDTAFDESGPHPLDERVVEAARSLAADAAAVHVVHAFPYDPEHEAPYRVLAGVREHLAQDDRALFERFADYMRVPAPCRHWIEAPALRGIDEVATRIGADLVVVGSGYHSTLDRFFTGSTAELLLERLDRDALLVKPDGFVAELGRHIDLDRLRRRQLLAA